LPGKVSALSISSSAYNETEKICASLLNTVDVAGYESRLDIRVEGTLDWVLVNPQYINWVSNASARILWVTGYAGCGKTTLASFIMRYLTGHLPRRALVCRFFCDNKIEELRDPSSLLRSLIFQIVNGRRRLWRLVKKASDAGGLHIFRQFDALWSLFVQMTRIENKSPITIIIDAIDECDKKAQLLVVSRISELLSLADTTVKFFITSRPNAEGVLDVQGQCN
jgi:Cdc6-like AAA superfamily ATPase